MAITHFECDFFRPTDLTLEFSSYNAFNPSAQPGSMVIASASAVKDGIGSQVACKLSLEQFAEGVLQFFTAEDYDGKEVSLEALESAFRLANNSVYRFGHKLAAGGKMAASLIGLVIQDEIVAAGRVGAWSAYLYRSGQLFPFFEDQETARSKKEVDGYVGVNSLISVELASVPIQAEDILVIISGIMSSREEKELTNILSKLNPNVDRACESLIADLYPKGPFPAFTMMTFVGPEAVYLNEVAQ